MTDIMRKAVTIGCVAILVSMYVEKAVADDDDVPALCYDLYYSLIESETWEAMGSITRIMGEEGCWLPVSTSALHSEGDESDTPEAMDINQQESKDFASNCKELAPHIMGMSERQDGATITKILSPKDTNSMGFVAIGWRQIDLERIFAGLNPIYSPIPPTKRTLDCVGTARFHETGQSLIQFWLDRDPDGEEFIGYQTID